MAEEICPICKGEKVIHFYADEFATPIKTMVCCECFGFGVKLLDEKKVEIIQKHEQLMKLREESREEINKFLI